MTPASPSAAKAVPASTPTNAAPEEADLPLLEEPAGGTPPVIDTAAAFEKAVRRLKTGRGPIGVDAERASGIRYGQRCFLAQFKREGTGILLIDTETLRRDGVDFTPLAEALLEGEWILHSAMQDLPCLAELGLTPPSVFDTEIAARLAGFERFGLAAVVARTLGIRLAKEHSNSDWSKRPLPAPWLTYAALDVEILADAREALIVELAAQGKLDWAYQEFQHLLDQGLPEPRQDPWRRTTALNTLKSRRQLAMARALWFEREHLAQHKDVSPSHLLPDTAIVAAVKAAPKTVPSLLSTPGFHGRFAKREAPRWLRALSEGAKTEDMPPLRAPSRGGVPQPKSWEHRNPEAFERYQAARPALVALGEELSVPQENLLQPAVLREVCWAATGDESASALADLMRSHGARPWQAGVVAPVLARAFAAL